MCVRVRDGEYVVRVIGLDVDYLFGCIDIGVYGVAGVEQVCCLVDIVRDVRLCFLCRCVDVWGCDDL